MAINVNITEEQMDDFLNSSEVKEVLNWIFEINGGGLPLCYVTSKDLPTVAMFVDISRAYAFKRTLVKQGIQAEFIQTEREI